MNNTPDHSFKQAQQKFERVRTAYAEKEKQMLATLKSNSITTNTLQVCFIAYKQEKTLELWGKNKTDKAYILLKTYDFCASSGILGPKRGNGDLQTPEGFYHIDRFNPMSNYYLSLGINYPNAADKLHIGDKPTGGDIFIHGNCVTIGCIPITDDKIKELYLYAIEARNNGQTNMPVWIFPAKLDAKNWQALQKKYANNKPLLNFWANLKTGYDYFEIHKAISVVSVDKQGFYLLQ